MKLIMENWSQFINENKCPESSFYGRNYDKRPVTDPEMELLSRDDDCGANARSEMLAHIADKGELPDLSPRVVNKIGLLAKSGDDKNFNIFNYLFKRKRSKTSGQPGTSAEEEEGNIARGNVWITNNTGRQMLAIIDNKEPRDNRNLYKSILELVPEEDMRALRSAEVRGIKEPMKYSLPFGDYDLDVVFGRRYIGTGAQDRRPISNGKFRLDSNNRDVEIALNDEPGEEAWRDEYRASDTVNRGLKIGLFNYSGFPLQLLYEGKPLRHILGHHESEENQAKIYTSPVAHWPWVARPAAAEESVAVQQGVDWHAARARFEGQSVPIGPERMVGLIPGREALLDRLEEGAYIELYAQFMTLPDDEGWVRPMREKKRIFIDPRKEFQVIHATSPGGQQVATPEGYRDQPWRVAPMDPEDAERIIMQGMWDNP